MLLGKIEPHGHLVRRRVIGPPTGWHTALIPGLALAIVGLSAAFELYGRAAFGWCLASLGAVTLAGSIGIGAALSSSTPEPQGRTADEPHGAEPPEAQGPDLAPLSALGQVTSELTHQVKNRLQAMMVHVAVLKELLAAARPEIRRSLDVLESEINRADAAVSRLSRAARPVEVSMRPLELGALLRQLVGVLAGEWEGKAIALELDPDPEPLTIFGDEELLRRAVTEILLDAAEPLRDGGAIAIGLARADSRAVVRISADPAPGRGAPSAADEARAPSGGAVGSATSEPRPRASAPALVRRVVELHGGDVDIDAASDGTARIVLRLPLHEAPRA